MRIVVGKSAFFVRLAPTNLRKGKLTACRVQLGRQQCLIILCRLKIVDVFQQCICNSCSNFK